MAIGLRTTSPSRPIRGRRPYRLRAAQVLAMVERGILAEGEPVELLDGVLYERMTKSELHNMVTGLIAEAVRRVAPAGYHVREVKSSTDDPYSLPEPDVGLCRGGIRDSYPTPPPLGRFALIAEVDLSTSEDEVGRRPARYATAGVPVYWQVDAGARVVTVHEGPDAGDPARYATASIQRPDDAIPIVVDGSEVGRVAVADLFLFHGSESP